MDFNNSAFWTASWAVVLKLVIAIFQWIKKKFIGEDEDIGINQFNLERKNHIGDNRLDFNQSRSQHRGSSEENGILNSYFDDMTNDQLENVSWKRYRRLALAKNIFVSSQFFYFFAGEAIAILILVIIINSADKGGTNLSLILFILLLLSLSVFLSSYYLSSKRLRTYYDNDIVRPFRYWNNCNLNTLNDKSLNQSLYLVKLREKQRFWRDMIVLGEGVVSIFIPYIIYLCNGHNFWYFIGSIFVFLIFIPEINYTFFSLKTVLPFLSNKKEEQARLKRLLAENVAERKGTALSIEPDKAGLSKCLSYVCEDVTIINIQEGDLWQLQNRLPESSDKNDISSKEYPYMFDTIIIHQDYFVKDEDKDIQDTLKKLSSFVSPGGKILSGFSDKKIYEKAKNIFKNIFLDWENTFSTGDIECYRREIFRKSSYIISWCNTESGIKADIHQL